VRSSEPVSAKNGIEFTAESIERAKKIKKAAEDVPSPAGLPDEVPEDVLKKVLKDD
jgi:hypothetical protein